MKDDATTDRARVCSRRVIVGRRAEVVNWHLTSPEIIVSPFSSRFQSTFQWAREVVVHHGQIFNEKKRERKGEALIRLMNVFVSSVLRESTRILFPLSLSLFIHSSIDEDLSDH